MPYQICIFDLDGTLTDPCDGVTNGFLYACGKLGINVKLPDPSEYIGPPLHESFKKICGLSDEDTIKAVAIFREYYSTKGLYENAVYPGITDMLESLHRHGIRLAVATTKYEEYACTVLEHFGLRKYFDFVSGDSKDGKLSRDGKKIIIGNALDVLDPKRDKTAVMIGDRYHDICGGIDAGIDSIGVLWGYGTHPELEGAGAAHVLETPAELAGLIL